jgi:outer membrane protein assembly factor BamB
LEFEGRSEIILVGGDCVTAHDADTGKELWRAGGWDPSHQTAWRLVPSVTVDAADGLIFACAPKKGPVMAIHDGGHGDVSATAFAWKTTDFTSDVCVPLLYKGELFVLDGDAKVLSCVDPKTGQKKWSGSLGGNAVFRASPTGADGKIYCMNENGDVWVLAADQFKVLSKTSFHVKQARAAIAVTDGQVLLRTGDTLYAFGSR